MVRLMASALLLATASAASAFAQDCVETSERHAVHIASDPGKAALSVEGDQAFHHAVGEGWIFALEPHPEGWVIRLYDREPISDARDLTAVTPPHHGPNPRDLFGWHFRNAANDGPNMGDVNAPQHLRMFFFSTALAGTGGYRAPAGGAPMFEPDPEDGRGWLKILDMGLDGLEPGHRAWMSHLSFEACLTWPKTP